jgi:hypothetical protein
VTWLHEITVLDQPFAGFFMDRAYRILQKGEEATSGEVMTGLRLKSIITPPVQRETVPVGPVTVLGAAYAGEGDVTRVELSVDNGTHLDCRIVHRAARAFLLETVAACLGAQAAG